MHKFLTFLLVILFAVGLAAQRPGPHHRGFGRFGIRGARTPVTGAPYWALETTQTQQTLAGGNQVTRDKQSKVYRDGLGRVRIEHTVSRAWATAGGTPQTVIAIFDPVAGYSYVLNPVKLTAVKMVLPPPAKSAIVPGPSPRGRGPVGNQAQVQTEDLGTQAINGVEANGTRRTETIPAGAIGNQQPTQVVRETWISPVLKVPVLIRSSDPGFGNTVMQLTNITQTEPDPSLFVVPSNYTVTARTGRGK